MHINIAPKIITKLKKNSIKTTGGILHVELEYAFLINFQKKHCFALSITDVSFLLKYRNALRKNT